jgi:class 3 adenylate cyclase/dienelactone hydrolase
VPTDIPQRLAAILAADIAGYTRLMERDEAGVVAAWRRARDEVIDPTVAQYRGRIVKLTGDGFLAEFSTAESAVKAALAMQQAFATMFGHGPMESRVAFRMGVNLGDVWVDADDIYGAGVNVAARLEALAEPGTLCISGSVHEAIKHKIAAHYEDLGQKTVKNVAEPIRAWRLRAPTPKVAEESVRESIPRAGRNVGGYVATAALAAGLAGAVFWFVTRDPDARWLVEEAIPQIEGYLDGADWDSAYSLAKQAEARVPDNPELAELWPRMSWRVTIPSDPPGATVFRQAYDAPDGAEWQELGKTPLTNIRLPYGLSRLRFELTGYRPLVRALGGEHLNWQELTAGNGLLDALLVGPETYKLDTEDTLPADKVRVPGWDFASEGKVLRLGDFLLGRYEVTNAEYKEFVDAGGYERWSLWDPVVVNGETVPFENAKDLFTDRTGRPGPSTWEGSDYRAGEDGLPVSGVSWYEASAYARFAGQELPTAPHWQQALANSMFPWLLPASNFGGAGPRAVAESRAMGYAGAFDMTGNVREWTATAIGDERVILGGSWNDPYYIAGVSDTSTSPLDRSPGNGIRLALTADEPAVAAAVRAPLAARTTATAAIAKPVADDVYAAYSRVFDYDRGALNASVEASHATHVWTRERVTFDAAYGSERMVMYLYLPIGSSPPYQTVVYWPGWDTFALDDADEYFSKQIDFIVKSGRAVAFPVYKGTFERRVGNVRGRAAFDTAAYRDNTIDTVKDLRRTIDYLETRREIDRNALGFFGYSWGGLNGPTALAQEPRLRLAVIDIGLLPSMASTPEVDPVNALPRVRVPTLMLSGEFDAMVPVGDARRYFALIGAPATEKRHVIVIGGHFIPREVLIRETLDWLDRYLGPTTH